MIASTFSLRPSCSSTELVEMDEDGGRNRAISPYTSAPSGTSRRWSFRKPLYCSGPVIVDLPMIWILAAESTRSRAMSTPLVPHPTTRTVWSAYYKGVTHLALVWLGHAIALRVDNLFRPLLCPLFQSRECGDIWSSVMSCGNEHRVESLLVSLARASTHLCPDMFRRLIRRSRHIMQRPQREFPLSVLFLHLLYAGRVPRNLVNLELLGIAVNVGSNLVVSDIWRCPSGIRVVFELLSAIDTRITHSHGSRGDVIRQCPVDWIRGTKLLAFFPCRIVQHPLTTAVVHGRERPSDGWIGRDG